MKLSVFQHLKPSAMKKILFPTDFSPAAENAFKYAHHLAVKLGMSLDVLHVYSLPFMEATNVPPDYIEEMMTEKRNAVLASLEKFVALVPHAKVQQKLAVYGMFIPEEINDYVESQGYDLVVMGTRGEHHSAFEKFIGSITSQTMLRTKCPVLAIPLESSWKEVGKIAFATDFAPTDIAGAEQLMAFAGALGAEVHFVHVETSPGIGQMEDYVTLANYPFEFTDFAVVNSPTVVEGLDKYLTEKRVDILALFIPKRKLWERLFHSSLTKKMAFHCKTPLLVFHA
jgi:nucleotide-binding universal stress UspA family protein